MFNTKNSMLITFCAFLVHTSSECIWLRMINPLVTMMQPMGELPVFTHLGMGNRAIEF